MLRPFLLAATAAVAILGCRDGLLGTRPDITAPTVSLTAPASDTLDAAAQVLLLAGTATDDVEIVRMSYRLGDDGEQDLPITPGASVAFEITLALPPGGPHALQVHAFDGAGNRGSSVVRSLTRRTESGVPQPDALAPTVTLTAPVSDTVDVGAQSVVVAGTAAHVVAIVRVTYSLGGSSEQEFPITPDTSVTFQRTIELPAGGPHALQVHAYDAAGNRGSSQVRRLTRRSAIDARITVHRRDSSNLYFAHPGAYLHIRGTVPGAVRLTYHFSYPGIPASTPKEIPLTGGPENPAFDIKIPDQTAYHLSLVAYDAEGRSTTQFYPNLQSPHPAYPVLTLNLPRAAGRFVDPSVGQIEITATASAPSGVRRVAVQIGDGPGSEIPIDSAAQVTFRWTAPLTNPVTELWLHAEAGDGHTNSVLFPFVKSPPPEVAGSFVQVVGGQNSSCALGADGQVYCWGSGPMNDPGRTSPSLTPRLAQPGLSLASITGKNSFVCGLDMNGRAYCWGSSFDGVFGSSSVTEQAVAAPVGGGLRFVRLSAGYNGVCGITVDSLAYCWGSNVYGEVGTTDPSTKIVTPTAVAGGLRFAEISMGATHACGVTVDQLAYCWGSHRNGELGRGTAGEPFKQPEPAPVVGGLKFTTIVADLESTCGLTVEGAAYCWGFIAQCFGNAELPCGDYRVPQPVTTTLRFVSLDIRGSSSACGITAQGELHCWDSVWRYLRAVGAGLRFASVRGGVDHACGVLLNQVAVCWGKGNAGELGNGTRYDVATPVRVRDVR